MALTRAELLKKASRRYAEHEGVRFQSLTELELSNLRGIWSKRVRGMTEETFDMEVLAVNKRELLAMTMVDTDGKRLFGNDEIEQVGELDPLLFDSLHDFARVHTGIAKEDNEVGRIEGNSETVTA